MLRGMVFIDHMNFDIALQKYYKSLGKPTIKLDYNKLFRNVCTQIANVDFLKGFIFVPKQYSPGSGQYLGFRRIFF